MDPVALVSLVLALIVFALGVWIYVSRKNDAALYIGVGFGLYAISHVLTLLELAQALTAFVIVTRVIAYLLVIFAMYRMVAKK